MLSQAYNIIIYCCVSAPVHSREMVDGPNAKYKQFIFNLMVTVKLPGAKYYDTQPDMQSATHNAGVSLSQIFKKNMW